MIKKLQLNSLRQTYLITSFMDQYAKFKKKGNYFGAIQMAENLVIVELN